MERKIKCTFVPFYFKLLKKKKIIIQYSTHPILEKEQSGNNSVLLDHYVIFFLREYNHLFLFVFSVDDTLHFFPPFSLSTLKTQS